ncbi:DNA-binding transcriptional regulator, MocR family, contains an aminotransferase domain [Pseudomonas guineae]|uniref:DNA-binding transcriptional regulator, MocR family, contains an aminotransferase domain n=1 Tax=Pseudomonas guineae TaxID=425504 RepID=A0A1I3FCV3_9PSED|nr:PLP-dependent aminotransferase family protein [Pseudomonas guineae]SFI08972.1 DNA-binding transcriptional regulator, MocR family, contains an aminotransferase domain [Pseudomonas guineae]
MTIDLKPFIRSGQPKYLAIGNALSEAINSGVLLPGSKLPTHRELAETLGVSVQTVSNAYAHAEKQGAIYAQVGSGTFVRSRHVSHESDYLSTDEHEDPSRGIDLSTAHPVCTPRHVKLYRESLMRLAREGRDDFITSFHPTQGLTHHREVVCAWLAQQKMPANPDHMLFCNGAAHALTIAMATVVNPGDTVFCERETCMLLLALAQTLHFKLKGLDTDEQGLLPDALEAACKQGGARVLFCTPTMNNPTSDTMSLERRQAIADLARRYDLTVVEDDVYGALQPDRHPPLSALIPERSFYATSLTKITLPGMRAGYLVTPPHLVQQAIGRLRSTTWMATLMPFEIASWWMQDGTLERMVAFQQQEFAARQQIARELLDGCRFRAHPNGMHIWAELPAHWQPEKFARRARQEGVMIFPAEPFLATPDRGNQHVRISLGAEQSRSRLHAGLTKLNGLFSEMPPPMHFVF